MIKKLLTLTLCLIITSCNGFTSGAGLKFKTGNRDVELKSGTFVMFQEPLGKCGASVTFFGILLPIIPVWFRSNSCEKSFDIDFTGAVSIPKLGQNANIKLKYNGVIYDPVAVEKLVMFYGKNGEHQSEYGKKFKFKIDNFWKFRMADDKAIIIIGKTEDGKEFTEELPVKWGIMTYNYWEVPGA
jgi:hypothetical protein